MEQFQFEKLIAWQQARQLVKEVYQLIKFFPSEERTGLASQLRRAVVSVPSNLAEGSERTSYKEKIHFIEIAFGSLMEVYCQLILAIDLGYIADESFRPVKDKIFELSRMISGLRKSFVNSAEPKDKG